MAIIADGRRRSPSCSGARRTTPPSARRLLRHKNVRALRVLRAMVMVSSGSNSAQRMGGQSQQRAVMAAASNLTTSDWLAAERLPTTQASTAESSQLATHQAAVCRQAMSPAPVAVESSISVARPAWGGEDVPPERYLLRLLEKRGRQPKLLSSTEAGYTRPPTEKQIKDYSFKPFITDLVRRGDIQGLEQALRAGRGMDASNKFGESVVHVACRAGNLDVIRFLVANGGSLTCCDDLGRFPLHEVCWAVEPRFDIVRLFLDSDKRGAAKVEAEARGEGEDEENRGRGGDGDTSSVTFGVNLLLVTDKRGCTPLRYVKQASWPQWRAFLEEIVDKY